MITRKNQEDYSTFFEKNWENLQKNSIYIKVRLFYYFRIVIYIEVVKNVCYNDNIKIIIL